MSREIKFRAYDKTKKQWVTEPLGFAMSVADGRYHIFGFNNGFTDIKQENIILMQYTGLKDKNGVEIYEGDILKRGAVVAYFSNLTWDSGGSAHPGYYCKQWFDYNEDGALSYGESFDDCEILGNIYENPELLDAK